MKVDTSATRRDKWTEALTFQLYLSYVIQMLHNNFVLLL